MSKSWLYEALHEGVRAICRGIDTKEVHSVMRNSGSSVQLDIASGQIYETFLKWITRLELAGRMRRF
jgi:hypothetical protein